MAAPKKAASRLGPSAQAPSQPPWAMVSADGSEVFYPQSAIEARQFAVEHSAVPANPDLWPWPNEVPLAGAEAPKEPAGQSGGQDLPTTTPGAAADNQSLSDEAPAAELGTEIVPAAAQSPAEAPAVLEGDVMSGCPTPALCWPLGLPDDCSYVTCVHGGWTVMGATSR